jgi:hypothetical protein
MTQYKITVNKNILHHLLSSNDEGMKELLKQILDQILEQQRTEQINAERYERTEERRGRRNGYKTRNLITRVGTITLRIPQIRDGVFSTDLFKRYQRSEQALVLALMEMVINGVSTRKVAAITEELCGTSFSASTVSGICLVMVRQQKRYAICWLVNDSKWCMVILISPHYRVRQYLTKVGWNPVPLRGEGLFSPSLLVYNDNFFILGLKIFNGVGPNVARSAGNKY